MNSITYFDLVQIELGHSQLRQLMMQTVVQMEIEANTQESLLPAKVHGPSM